MAWKTSVLVVANVTAASDELIAALRERAGEGPAEFMLLLPATGGDSAAARGEMQRALERMREAGLEVTGKVGDRDPVVAVHEVWDPRRFDEVVVSTLPTGASRWLQIDLPHRVERLTDVPVRHVVARPKEEPRRTYAPPPKPEHHGLLTPLETLGWSGKRQEQGGPAAR
jgi:GABA permease